MDEKSTAPVLTGTPAPAKSGSSIPTAPTADPVGAPQKDRPTVAPPKKKRKWVKRLIVIVVIVALAALLLSRCMGGGKGVTSSAYIPAQAAMTDMTVTVTGTGTVTPNDSFNATALVKGEVTDAPFEEGDAVQKGDLLYAIDDTDAQTAVKQAQAQIVSAQKSVEQAQISLQQAQLSYDTLVKNKADTDKNYRVEANAAGAVTKVYVDQGDTVAAGSPIADILDRDNMKLKVPFHSGDAAGFYVGQPATITVGGTAETLSGSISDIAATDSVGPGGTLVRNITVKITNPGALSDASTGSAAVGTVSSAGTGTFAYGESKQVVAKAGGNLERLTVKEGDRVYDGQVLGQFEQTDVQSQIDNAALAIKTAQVNLASAQDGVGTAQLGLDTAQNSLEDYTITSTINGTVIEKNYKVGDNIDPNSSAASTNKNLAVIYDMSRLTFDMSISELDVVKLKVGQSVTFTTAAVEGKTFTGHVDKININGTTANGSTSYPVTVVVDNGEGLYPGMNVSATILVEKVGNVLTIPVDAVQRGNTVLVAAEGALDKDGNLVDPSKLESRDVTLGRNDSENIEVTSGLEEGETVYVSNQSTNAMAMMMGG